MEEVKTKVSIKSHVFILFQSQRCTVSSTILSSSWNLEVILIISCVNTSTSTPFSCDNRFRLFFFISLKHEFPCSLVKFTVSSWYKTSWNDQMLLGHVSISVILAHVVSIFLMDFLISRDENWSTFSISNDREICILLSFEYLSYIAYSLELGRDE